MRTLLRGAARDRRKAAPEPRVSSGAEPVQATIRPSRSPGAEAAARTARDALAVGRPSAAPLAAVLTALSCKQRQAVKRHYRLLYGQDLEADVAETLAGHFQTAVLALLQESLDYLGDNLHAAIMKIAPDPAIFVELLYGHNSAALQNIKEHYNKKYGRELTRAVARELNGDYQRLLSILLSGERDSDGQEVHEERALEEAQMLSRAGVGVRYGTDEPVLVSLLRRGGRDHLRAVFSHYHRLSGRSVLEAVAEDFSGAFRNGLLALVSAILDHLRFFATLVHDALTRHTVRDDRLIRIFVSRSENDLGSIKGCYLTLYGTKLSSAIMDATTGDYQQLMYKVLDPN